MRNRMVIENLSPRTIRSYIHYPLKLAEFFNANPRTLTTEEIYAFLVYLKEEKHHSRSTMRIAVSGIRYLYQHILKRSSIIDEVPYPKQEKYLPEILSGKEVKRLFILTENIKHKAILMLAYSAGLRRSEIIDLLLVDIYHNKAVLIGNIDPSGVLALGTVKDVSNKTLELLEIYKDSNRFILNAGCAIPAETPSDNLKAMIKVAREF